MTEAPITTFISAIDKHLESDSLIKISLSDYAGIEPDLKRCEIRPILLKDKIHLSYIYKYKTRDITKNFLPEQGLKMIADWLGYLHFKAATLLTTGKKMTMQYQKNKWHTIQSITPLPLQRPGLKHDHTKKRIISPDKKYLQLLSVSSQKGQILSHAQDKYKQINHYIDLLTPAIQSLSLQGIEVVDMGAGKGYLTFALYDYLRYTLGKNCTVTGVEFRQDLVDQCNQVAADCTFDQLHFEQGTIEGFEPGRRPHILIALHACDTATDDAIFQGIRHQSEIIVTAPCCHKQIRRQMEQNKIQNISSFLHRFGIFLERNAEMITDGIRALILEYFGYRVKVMQFISDAHTPKNVMILAEKSKIDPQRQKQILHDLQAIKSEWGIGFHYLERLTLQ